MNLTRERIRQVETRGLLKLRAIAEDEPRSGEHGSGNGPDFP
jgi:DNA-directed RNA polymerase sigma subunit (sigma70/sigma32)